MFQDLSNEETINIKLIPNGIENVSILEENKQSFAISNKAAEPDLRFLELERNNSSQSASPVSNKRLNIKDFDKITELGRGAYAKVDLRKSRINNKLIAIKILNKHFMEKLNKTHEAYIEKEILSKISHPNIIKLLSTFQDRNKLYFVLEYASNRDLASFIRSQGILSCKLAKFYTAEIINALEYLHNKKISHRDLKPENMILTNDMHLKIIDFGTASISGMYFCKKEMKFKPKNGGNDEEDKFVHHGMNKFDITKYEDYITYTNSSSFVGTAEYASPELLKNNIINAQSVDLWALGCIVYKFFHGKTPFLASNDIQIFKNIIDMKYEMAIDIPDEAKDFINKLLVEDPMKRLGVGEKGSEFDFEALKSHEFFKDISFEDLYFTNPPLNKEYISPKNSQKDLVIHTTSCVSNKFRSADLNELNLNLSDNSISFFDTSEVFNYSPIINHKRHYSCNNLLNLKICDYSFDTYSDDWLLDEDYIKVKQDLNIVNPSIIHEKIVKKKGWIIYNLIKLRLLSNGRLEVLDVYSNELLDCMFINSKTKVRVLDTTTFEILSNKKSLVFKSIETDIKLWISHFKKLIYN